MIQNEFHIQQAEKHKMLDSMLSFLIFERGDKKLYDVWYVSIGVRYFRKTSKKLEILGAPGEQN